MKSTDTNILNFIMGMDKVFIIPPFQRNYEWSYEQCNELFIDIENAYKNQKSHYLGNVVYFLGENNGASYTELILVDGQQRVTTVLLLLCALRDLINDQGIVDSINRRYLINDSSLERFRVRLKQTAYDSDGFLDVIEKRPLKNLETNVVKNYLYFIELIKKSQISPRDIFETMNKLEVVDVNLQIRNDLSQVQTVFEKINSTGKRLTPADLIRNYLLLANNSVEQDRLYSDYWIKIEQTVKNEYISRFARDYLIMNIFDDVPEEKIYKMFREHFDAAKAVHIDILREMYSLSKYYSWLCHENCPSKKLNIVIKELNLLKSDDLYPLYIYLFSKMYEVNLKELLDILTLLSDFMIRYRTVSPSGGGGALRSAIQQLLEGLNSGAVEMTYESILFELSNSASPSARFPNDNEFKLAIMESVNMNYARVLLMKIESSETKNIPVQIDLVTIEHLMPQKLSPWWIENLGGEIQAEKIYDQYIDCIGNLAPISQGYNSKNSNKPWSEKVKQLKDVQFVVTSKTADEKEWKERELIERNIDIASRACIAITAPLDRVRKYQTKNPSVDFASGLYPVSDLSTSMNGTSLKSLIYDQEVIEIDTWKEFLNLICKFMQQKDAKLFEKIVVENMVHKATSTLNYPKKDPIISTESSRLREPKAIGTSAYYSEGCISSNRARFYAKQILDIFEMTEKFQIEVSER